MNVVSFFLKANPRISREAVLTFNETFGELMDMLWAKNMMTLDELNQLASPNAVFLLHGQLACLHVCSHSALAIVFCIALSFS